MSMAHTARQSTMHVDPDGLRDHLVHHHGRRPHEIAGLPLRALHALEHFEGSMGLIDLEHGHPA
jgi:hypothetical protein